MLYFCLIYETNVLFILWKLHVGRPILESVSWCFNTLKGHYHVDFLFFFSLCFIYTYVPCSYMDYSCIWSKGDDTN